MHRQYTLAIFVLLGLLVGLVLSGGTFAQQADPTADAQTMDAQIQQMFDATVTAEAQIAGTATVEAAFEQALTATAEYQATLDARFNAAMTATSEYQAPLNAAMTATALFERINIVYGDTVEGTVTNTEGERWYFYGRAGDEIVIGMGGFDTVLELYAPDGSLLTWDDDGGMDRGSRITYRLPYDGTYIIAAKGYGESTGMYVLSLVTSASLTATAEYQAPLKAMTATALSFLTLEELQERAQIPVTRNNDWTSVEREFDLPGGGTVTMVLVPAGCFMMGSDDGDSDEQPVHQQCFDEPFWIDKYEVTNEQYGSSGIWLGDDLPRETVNWFDARDFCESRGSRLPTEAEWEYAARGPDGLVYPWGDEWNADNANWADTSPDPTFAVGSFPGGVSWVGAHDLSGNLWEWVSSLYQDYPYDDNHESNSDNSNLRVLRGGSWYGSPNLLRAADRLRYFPDDTVNDGGVRCARS